MEKLKLDVAKKKQEEEKRRGKKKKITLLTEVICRFIFSNIALLKAKGTQEIFSWR